MPDPALTRDAFLGGRLQIIQPKQGYRAGIDPVFLAACVEAKAGQSVLDLGCGVGVAALCLGARVPGLSLTGIERQAEYADLARRNAASNGIAMEVVTGDLATMPAALRTRQFDHVIANPPYFDRTASTPAQDAGREAALGENTPLATWLRAAARRTVPGGSVTIIHQAERLPDLLAAAAPCLGSLSVLPLIARAGRPARLVILRARKGGRARFCLLDGWVLHDGAFHAGDHDDYSAATTRILRHGDPIAVDSNNR